MSNSSEEQAGRGTKAPNQEELPSSAGARAVTSEVSQAVGKYALTESLVDVKITSNLVKLGVEVEALGARVQKLEHELAALKKTTHNPSRSGAHA